ncbi:tudor domain-containing protein 3 [Musca vetustissima]|uniref:tudor domain-containing protein 3 n=1 Tax=Musca vetustissima TaxID=27455 RepID=UPI002AB5E259|nr:tudor domain-containing protein 3 [Musca vetustissima]
MALLQKLKDQGWHLTQEGLKKLTTELQTEDVQKIIKAALDWDLKEIGGGAIPSKPESNGNIPGRIVLQMQKMRNISAPKANEESTAAPRFLQLELTDGTNSILALELERIPNLHLKVPPGTKLYFKADKLQLMQGLLVLKEAEVQILGGNVEHMVEKWELARQMQKYARSNRRLSGSGGPPPWIDFGKRLDAHRDALPQDKNFKSLQAATEKDKNSKENDEFTASRTQAIAEAAKAGQKKVFGGGQQNILDHNVKKILEKGYSEEDAKYALKATNNNLERALYNLKRRNKGTAENPTKTATAPVGNQRGRGSAKEEVAAASKPQTNVSLFDFLTDKLPATVTTETPPAQTANNSSRNTKEITKSKSSESNTKPQPNTSANKFENNMSSSFAANRAKPEEKTIPSQNQQSQRSSYNQRDERKSNPPNKQGNRGNERGRNNAQNNERISINQSANNNEVNATPTTNNVNNNVSNGNNNNTTSNTNYRTNLNRRNDRNERPPPPRKDQRDQTTRPSAASGGGNYQGNRRSQEYRTNDSRPYQQRDNNNRNANENKNASNYQQNQQAKPASNVDIDKLVESTSKMTIQNKKETTYSSSQNRGGRHQNASTRSSNAPQNNSQQKSASNQVQQSGQFIGSQNFTNKTTPNSSPQVVPATNPQQQPQSQQQQTNYVSQLPNGFAYDPSKIMGFQTKEANEYAMNLLKSQGLLPQQSPVAGTQGTAQPTQVPQPPQPQPQIITNPQAAPAVTYITPSPNSGYVAAPQQQCPMEPFGMMPQGGAWPWRVGDLCMAKYWEDGNYYNAEITGVSENTCVVLFLGYGNHEEVVKTDCLPLRDESHYPMNAYQGGPPPTAVHAPMQQLPPTFLAANSAAGNGGVGGGSNQRYRGERQMYVPPPKRGNNNN